MSHTSQHCVGWEDWFDSFLQKSMKISGSKVEDAILIDPSTRLSKTELDGLKGKIQLTSVFVKLYWRTILFFYRKLLCSVIVLFYGTVRKDTDDIRKQINKNNCYFKRVFRYCKFRLLYGANLLLNHI